MGKEAAVHQEIERIIRNVDSFLICFYHPAVRQDKAD